MTKQTSSLLPVLALIVVGCGGIQRFYEGEPRPPGEVATIHNCLFLEGTCQDQGVIIVQAIDDVDFEVDPGGSVELLAGTYALEYTVGPVMWGNMSITVQEGVGYGIVVTEVGRNCLNPIIIIDLDNPSQSEEYPSMGWNSAFYRTDTRGGIGRGSAAL